MLPAHSSYGGISHRKTDTKHSPGWAVLCILLILPPRWSIGHFPYELAFGVAGFHGHDHVGSNAIAFQII